MLYTIWANGAMVLQILHATNLSALGVLKLM